MKNTSKIIFSIACLLFPIAFFAHGLKPLSTALLDDSKRMLPTLEIRRSGPYVGIQQGKYRVLELGGEMQWNKAKLIKPITHAVHTGLNYNFKYNVFGFDAGYWIKRGRFDFTYGANFVLRTDFTKNAIGIAPVVGYKIWQLHLQAGYHLLGASHRDFETNTLFVSLRYVYIKNSDWDWKKRNKKPVKKGGVRWL